MKRSGSADLPLHYGTVSPWLATRMAKLGLAITESIITEYGKDEFLPRISDPFWFQSLGAVMGMDWHSSGITTSVMGTLKRTINPISKELSIYICGGKGKYSKLTLKINHMKNFTLLVVLCSLSFSINAQIKRIATTPTAIVSQIPGYSQITTII